MVRFAADREKLEVLFTIYTRINSTYTDVKALLTLIIESATELTEGEASSLMLVNPENNRLYFEIALGPKGPSLKQYTVNMGEGIAGWVAEKNTSLIVNDAQNDARFYPEIAEKIGFPTTSILAVPMLVKEKLVGVIEILNKRGGKKFTEEDLQWLEIFSTQAAIAVQNARSYQKVRNELSVLQDKVQGVEGWHTFIGESRIIKDRLEIARKAAATESSVLLLGESGVGKERVAHAIHHNSSYASGPYVIVNCAALPESLIESELFGHEKGAFTGATAFRKGRFELANSGTIFLDEIGDLPPVVQTKLLRVLQERVFERIGGNTSIKVSIRIIAATNRDLEALIREGKFREDLYYRLNIFPIVVPPLRERKTDIILLANYFIEKYAKEMDKKIVSISVPATDMLMAYHWPGNVRELENCIERAIILCTDGVITTRHLPPNLQKSNDSPIRESKGTLQGTLTSLEKEMITDALKRCHGKMAKAARLLGLTERVMALRVVKFGIDPRQMK